MPTYSDRVGVWRNVGDVDLVGSFTKYEAAFGLRFFPYLSRLLLRHDPVSQQWWERKVRELPRPPSENPLSGLLNFIEDEEGLIEEGLSSFSLFDLFDEPNAAASGNARNPNSQNLPAAGKRKGAGSPSSSALSPLSALPLSSSSTPSSSPGTPATPKPSAPIRVRGRGSSRAAAAREQAEAYLQSAREAQYGEFVAAVELSVARRYPATAAGGESVGRWVGRSVGRSVGLSVGQ